jgi:hypothetical protein
MRYRDRTIHLIDTPGFDDTERSDSETLQELSFWLALAYENDVYLSGIIYLHRITDLRIHGAALRALNIMKGLCGSENYQNIIIATTRWDELGGNQRNKALKRQDELCQKEWFWGDIIQAGGCAIPLADPSSDSLKIFDHIMSNNRRFITAFQYQLVEEERRVFQTDAGRIVYEATMDQMDKDIEASLHEAKDVVRMELTLQSSRRQDNLKEFRADLETSLQQRRDNIEGLKVSAHELQERWLARLCEDEEADEYSLISTSSELSSLARAPQPLLRLQHNTSSRSSTLTIDGKDRWSQRIPSLGLRSSLSPPAAQRHDEDRLNRRERTHVVRTQKTGTGMTAISIVGTALGAGQLLAAMACIVM